MHTQPAESSLIQIPRSLLHPHPDNANVMPTERLEKLANNIRRNGRYPPLVVRPHPTIPGAFQIIDGEQRDRALELLGVKEAWCFVWPCDDATTLLLLATLNALRGEDVPARRAALLAELTALIPDDTLMQLLPEDAGQISDILSLLNLDVDTLLKEIADAHATAQAQGPRLISFAVDREDAIVIETTIAHVMDTLTGTNRRGRALGVVCRTFLEGRDA